MNNKITIYGREACEEVLLPTISEQSFRFRLEKNIYNFKSDIVVAMQVLDDTWCFSESKKYGVFKGKENFALRKTNTGDILELCPIGEERLLAVMGEQEQELPVFRKYLLDKKKNLSLGHAASNDIILSGSALISKTHASIEYVSNNWLIRDISRNGIYVNGIRIHDWRNLEYGDEIEIFGCRFIYLKDILAVKNEEGKIQISADSMVSADKEHLKWISMIPTYANDEEAEIEFRPSPRTIAEYDTEEFEIEAPPAPKKQRERSLFMTLGPSITMALPMLIGVVITGMGAVAIGMITMVGSAVIGAFWAYMNQRSQKKNDKMDEEERFQKYSEYLNKKECELKEKYEFNAGEMRKMYPSAVECLKYGFDSPGLWNRNHSQKDYLFVRLGIGEMSFQKPVRIPQERFTLIHDTLAGEPKRIKETYENLKDVPVGVDLSEHSLIGVIGGKEYEGVYPILQSIITQVTANISYTDVKIILLCDGRKLEDRKLLEQTKWLPHMWDDTHTFRFAGDSEQSIIEVLNEFLPELRQRREEGQANNGQRNDVFSPYYIFVVTAPELLEESQASVYLLDRESRIGTTTILCTDSFERLPNSCEFMIENTEQFVGEYAVTDARENWKKIQFDSVSGNVFSEFAHRLAAIHIKTPETQQDIPSMITFLDMYGAKNTEDLQILQRWKNSRSYESLRVPIGMRSGGLFCSLDIHENTHGPHGLVAGTTGSGKSEMLQTWILSMAVNFSPEDISFFIVDFKGGGMANQFEKLPHLAGQITNLGGNQIHRALVSIRSENIRRQRMFAENGTKNIYEYTRAYKNHEVQEALPHLLIVVDEFAELKKEHPEFMSELISVAAIGRSLGVHLILATQKPAGIVDDKIESNTRFRICLKVQDKQDSNDMLKHPDAAYITQTGRGYLRVGLDEIYEQFQSAWSGASYQTGESQTSESLAMLYNVNGRTEIIGSHQKMLRKSSEKKKWVEMLLHIIEEQMKEHQMSAKKYLADSEERDNMNGRLYEYFRQQEWKIQPGAYNDSRLTDFFTIYDICESTGCQEVTAEAMLELAGKMGRTFPEAGKRTQLDAVVDAIYSIAAREDLNRRNHLWLPELPNKMYLKELLRPEYPAYIGGQWEQAKGWSLEACVGRYDDPEHQFQAPVFVDFANQGNCAVCGGVASGKSTFLQTLIYSLISRYSPEQVNLYCLDFSSRMLECFEQAPHLGGIIYEQNMELLGKFFFMMKQIITERKQILKGGSYAQYIQQGDKSLPAIVIVIDQYGSFREKTDNLYDTQIMELAKEGNTNGVYLMLSAGGFSTGEIPLKLADTLKNAFCLQLNDMFQYREVLKTQKVEVFPEEGIKGRGLMNFQGKALEYQTALALKAENDFARGHHIQKICKNMRESWRGECARAIPMIPKNPVLSDFTELPEVKRLLEDDRHLPLGYDLKSAAPWSLDLSKFYCYLVSGKKRSGKTNFLQLAMRMAAQKGGRLYAFGNGHGILEKTAMEVGASYYSEEDDLVPFCAEIKPYLMERNRKKHELEYNGYSDEEIYREMSREENIYLFIDDLVTFTELLYRPQEGKTSVSGFFETFSGKGWYHQIYIFAGLNQEERYTAQGREFYENIIRDREGIHFGGNADEQMLLKFDYINSIYDSSRAEPLGVGYSATGGGRMHAGKVIIPLARK